VDLSTHWLSADQNPVESHQFHEECTVGMKLAATHFKLFTFPNAGGAIGKLTEVRSTVLAWALLQFNPYLASRAAVQMKSNKSQAGTFTICHDRWR
jgi:hypothetical protein